MSLDLARDAIFVTLAGSQAHGTAREGSDVDLRGACVAPLDVRLSLSRRFEQHEGALEGPLGEAVSAKIRAHPTASRGLAVKTEAVIYDVAKLLELAAAANPNALEILFADERDWLHATPRWRRIHDARRRFLTRKVKDTFHGYAMAQLARIQTHRGWLLSPPERRPVRADFGLPDEATLSRDDQNRLEQAIAETIRGFGVDDVEMPKAARVAVEHRMRAFYIAAAGPAAGDAEGLRAVATRALGLPRAVVDALAAERRYRGALRRWEAYEAWRAERNPARAELERRFGYDTKHAMHLVRLMTMGVEALATGDLSVRRPDADELRAIRDGALSYEALVARAESLRAQMVAAAASSSLPADVDPAFVDALVLELATSAP